MVPNDFTMLTQILHQSRNTSELTTNIGLLNACTITPNPWVVAKWNTEIYVKNLQFGSELAYNPNPPVSLFETNSGALQPSTSSTPTGLFDVDGNGDYMPQTSNITDTYFDLDGNGDIEPS